MADRKQAEYNIHNYVSENKSSFNQSKFNEVDGLVMTQVSNMKLDSSGIGLYSGKSKTFSEIYAEMCKEGTDARAAYNQMSDDEKLLIAELADSPRYKDMSLSNFVHDPSKSGIDGFPSVGKEQHMEQFAAVTITYEQNGETYNYVSYRATDGSSDGWAEDLAMLYSMNTQAQSDSTNYMNIIAGKTEGYIVGGGHSKGGGDFEYAYLFCDSDVRDRIVKGYVYDSPGLTNEVLSKTEYYDQYKKITDGSYICPQDSIIGQVLHEGDNAVFVHSVESGFNEHDPYSWAIDPDIGTFQPDQQTEKSKYINSILDRSVENMSQEEREAVFKFVSFLIYNNGSGTDGIEGLGKLFTDGWTDEDGSFRKEKLVQIITYLTVDLASMSKDERKALGKSVGDIAAALISGTYDYAKDKVEIWFNQKIESFKEKCRNTAKAVQDWVIDRKNDFLDFLDDVAAEYTAQMLEIKQFFKETFDKNYKAAQEYLGDTRLLQFDTGELYGLAERLWAVNGRLESLDHRLDNLYRNVKWSDLGKIIKVASADFKIGWSPRINNCADWLRDTAGRFEAAEQAILNMLD